MTPPLRVLVVDDNPQDRRLVIRELKKAYPEAVIDEAIDQTQLDSRVTEANFDLVVTDYHLKWSDGIRVLQAVKERAPHCPVIMFTATGNEEVAVEAMKQGLDDYIIKNVKHLVRLRGAVQAAIEHASTRTRAVHLESRLESVLSQLQFGIFSCTTDGRFVELNDAMVRLLDQEFAAGPDRSLQSLFDDAVSAAEFLKTVVDSREPRETEIVRQLGDSSARTYRLHARVVADGGQTRIDGLIEDVTTRKQSEAEAKEAAVAAAQIAMLSPREKDVLDYVVLGSANKVIARRLEISEKTVEKHRSSLMRKLRLRSVAEVVRLAMVAENASA